MSQTKTNTVPMDLMTLMALHASLMGAQSMGILKAAMGKLSTKEEYARELQMDERAVGHVLQVLAAAGLLQCEDKRYGILPPKDGSAFDLMAVTAGLQQHFDHVPQFLRTGQPVAWMDESLVQREATYRMAVIEMGKGFAAAAVKLATQLALTPERILDVGCGSGVWSLEIARPCPAASVTGLDFPAVLEAFAARGELLEMKDRIRMLPGDMFSVDIPAEHYDLVVVANVLRLEAPARASQLLHRLVQAVRPGGQLLVVDAIAGGSPMKELVRAAYALHLALRTQVGTVHAPKQISDWMREAGLDQLREVDCGLQLGAVGAIIGIKGPR